MYYIPTHKILLLKTFQTKRMHKKDIDSEYSVLVKLVCFKKKTHMPLRNQHYPKEDPSFKGVKF